MINCLCLKTACFCRLGKIVSPQMLKPAGLGKSAHVQSGRAKISLFPDGKCADCVRIPNTRSFFSRFQSNAVLAHRDSVRVRSLRLLPAP